MFYHLLFFTCFKLILLYQKKKFCFINSFYKRKSIKNLAQVQGFPNSGKWWKESEILLGGGGGWLPGEGNLRSDSEDSDLFQS